MKSYDEVDNAEIKAIVGAVNSLAVERIENYKPIRTVGVKKDAILDILSKTIADIYQIDESCLTADIINFYNSVWGEEDPTDDAVQENEVAEADVPEGAYVVEEGDEQTELPNETPAQRKRRERREAAEAAGEVSPKKERKPKTPREPKAPKEPRAPRVPKGVHVIESIEKMQNWTDDDITAPCRFVDRLVAIGGFTEKEILDETAAYCTEKFPTMLSRFKTLGNVRAHLKYRQDRGWVMESNEEGRIKLVEIQTGVTPPAPKPRAEKNEEEPAPIETPPAAE